MTHEPIEKLRQPYKEIRFFFASPQCEIGLCVDNIRIFLYTFDKASDISILSARKVLRQILLI